MIKHILTIIWNQRRANGWIFAELLLVVAILWVMMDSLLVNAYTYYSPLGFDIGQVYKVSIGKRGATTPGYIPDSLKATSDGEDFVRLADNLRQAPGVEECCLAAVACPYTWANSWSSLIQADADTAMKSEMYQYFMVTPSYFDVLRMEDKSGHRLRAVVEQSEGGIVITADMEERFFKGGEPGKGAKVKSNPEDSNTMTVAAVSTSIRQTEYVKSSPCFYWLMRTDQDVIEVVERMRAHNMDCLIRMEEGFGAEEMEAMLQEMGGRIEVNNLYVSSVRSLEDMREGILHQPASNMKKKLMLIGFMLVNVFFGIVGTFWLRTQYRRGEMGLRTALGASRKQLKRFMNLEGLSLLVLTIPLLLLFIVNMNYFDLPDTDRLPYTWWRFAITLGAALLLLAGMIVAGIWLPARKIMKMDAAEALHYE